jgi:hypothetical protein
MIFNKKEVTNTFDSNDYITVNKKEVDKVLNNKDFTKFKNIFESIPISSVLYAINEKHRLAYLIKKHDLKFIDTIFNFFDKNNTLEDFHKFSDSVYTKSTDKQFAFKKGQAPIEDKLIPRYIDSRNQDIFKFKRKVMAKIFHHKENTEPSFIYQSLDMLKKHDLTDDYMIRKLSSVVLKSNFEANHNQVIKHPLFNNKRIRKEYISYVFQASPNVENLNILMKDFEADIRNIFFEKKDNNDYWFDFKITKGRPEEGIPYCNSVRPWTDNTNKIIWLEKNHMGFSHVETPYYIEFLKFFDLDKLEDFLTKVDRDKYMDMFNRSVIDYQQLSADTLNTPYVGNLETKHALLRQLTHKEWDSSHNFYEIIKNGLLNYDLQHNLEVKEAPRKVNKI